MTTISVSQDLKVIRCGGCGWTYAIPEAYHAQARENGEKWYWRCPNARCQWNNVAIRDSEVDRLRKEVERQTQRAEREAGNAKHWSDAHARVYGEKERERKARKKAERRAACGTCPCCKRSFAATRMAAHVKSKHPEFVAGGSA